MNKSLIFLIFPFLFICGNVTNPQSTAYNTEAIKQKVSDFLYKDLFPEAGEKLTILNIETKRKKNSAEVFVSWRAHLVDDGLHYKPLFHPPSTLDTEEINGAGRFQLKDNSTLDFNAPITKESLKNWHQKLLKVRDLMRQVVTLRCMYFCRHNYGSNTESDLNHALEELHNLSIK
ncbi:hypothetical protein A7Q10_03210 [Methylacidiphilum caldifontis]|uniref:Uncharacterized protein n=1 Tax=Methylacidiphilum caldifontis TaxID=2795386 RepID=A0A4Y8PHW2_9BACT|nr:hypothetical protein A7Q10_03210 [Methylacidiphilum caldifontis]